MAKIIVDGMGKQCPIPVVMTKKQVEKLDGPADVEVHVDNDTAVQNVTRLGNTLGAQVETEKISDSEFHITLHVGQDAIDAAGAGKGQDAVEACDVVSGRNVVYAFTSRYMGTGDDKLGEKLMKSCIYAITQLDTLPKAMLFYNGGAFLTTEGSDVLEDLKKMEDEGVQIITCGTCADFYGIKDKVKVGIIGNMYDIVSTMNEAGHVVRP
ncbi:MAG: sulfurtransferase-like selenium metabolism protein YedF [Eubacterium sp.]|jgi:selenium metabolism protein YedF|nr:sulfurtransferase-like selenium metabolism protein YedF [Eubacterium sp.]MCH4047027.1 sulfurtransferase-like selenium metabolism protein YedF [Eubacterium sp.]MCH4080125.1 sulfurtransferase-like selenium metabolism protein YedF [Eubacterium sp.]MCH4110913.1 sulfurtransferase-like selenium metabolism protein YedF [Eubacterium sp.]MCI1306756.1 sulfurtransferase-like selenium metabolism protein YedF [Eubacterium sp.]